MTARHVVAAVDPERFVIDAIGITRSGDWLRTNAGRAIAAGRLDELPPSLEPVGDAIAPLTAVAARELPVVVLPLLHGPMGEDGTVQGMLDLAGVPYVGSGVLGSALCMDKAMAKQTAASFGIAQARWITLHSDDITAATAAEIIDELGDVTFVKPANMGSSVGVSRARTADELQAALDIACTYDEWIVRRGSNQGARDRSRRARQSCPRSLGAGRDRSGDDFYSYDDKYHDGVAQTLIPADLTSEQTAEVRPLPAMLARRCGCKAWLASTSSSRNTGADSAERSQHHARIHAHLDVPKLWEASGSATPNSSPRWSTWQSSVTTNGLHIARSNTERPLPEPQTLHHSQWIPNAGSQARDPNAGSQLIAPVPLGGVEAWVILQH